MTCDSDIIFSKFSANTRNEIRKCEKFTNININYNASYDDISYITAQMFKQKGIVRIQEDCIVDSNCRFGVILQYKSIVIAHSFFVDEINKLVLLRTSASLFRDKDGETKKNTGYLNRYLHWQEMLYFKQMGYLYYDLGGLGFEEEYLAKNSGVESIIHFKRSFGGQIKKVFLYEKKPIFKILKYNGQTKFYMFGKKIITYRTKIKS